MNKVVYNACYGGFSMSAEAVRWLAMHARVDIKAIARKADDCTDTYAVPYRMAI